MRTYQLIRYAPDPARGETINVAIVAIGEGEAKVLVLPRSELLRRTECIAPHVSAMNAFVFMRELVEAAGDPARVQSMLATFDPHFRFEEPRRISDKVDVDRALASAFKSLVAQPPKRTKTKADRWSIDRAIDSLFRDAPDFGHRVRRHVSPADAPEVFGLTPGLFDEEVVENFTFDAVLPNCVRVVALKGFILSKGASLENFYELRAGLAHAKHFFAAQAPTKEVITGALLLPHRDKPVALHTRDEMRHDLLRAVRSVTIDGEPRVAIFDTVDPVDLRDLNKLAAEMDAGDDAPF